MTQEEYGPILKELKEWKRDRSRIFTQYRDWLKRLQNLERKETDPNNQSGDTSETNAGIITTSTVNNTITKSKTQRKWEADMANKKSNGEPSPEPKINHQENEISKIYVQMFAKQFNKILINKNKDD